MVNGAEDRRDPGFVRENVVAHPGVPVVVNNLEGVRVVGEPYSERIVRRKVSGVTEAEARVARVREVEVAGQDRCQVQARVAQAEAAGQEGVLRGLRKRGIDVDVEEVEGEVRPGQDQPKNTTWLSGVWDSRRAALEEREADHDDHPAHAAMVAEGAKEMMEMKLLLGVHEDVQGLRVLLLEQEDHKHQEVDVVADVLQFAWR